MPDTLNDQFLPFTTAEYEVRVRNLQGVMASADLDAAVFTSEDNYRYITGFYSPTWINLTRPRYCVVPRVGEPVIIIPANNDVIAAQTSWIRDVRTWVAPNPTDDGVTMVVDAIRACLGKSKRIGMELGPESRLTMPIGDFLRVREMLDAEIVDGFGLLHGLRIIKSLTEIERMRRIAQITSRSFEALAGRLKVGDSEKDASAKLRLELIARGADTTPYVSGGSGRNGYTSINTALLDRVLTPGDILTIDTGSTVDSYFCDFNRSWAIGTPSDEACRAYELVWRSTEAGLAAARPGAQTADVWRAMAKVLAKENRLSKGEGQRLGQGRFGHGCGLRMCEPPSLNERDGTVLKQGMVITLEPGTAFTARDADGETGMRVMVHEENVVITDDGCELLTTRAPRELPVVG
jgi:Xaa-Pro aminopeptidase